MKHPDHDSRQPADDRSEHQLKASARRYVQQLRAFYVHTAVFAGGMTIIFSVNLATNAAAGITGEWWARWSAWAFVGWGLGISVHGLVVRLNRPGRSSPNWERRKIDEVLSR